ncbi:hypothetical protein P3342_002010 [Pyrenophora teres f. teres]|nr:hypothetical protein P3342_002010 [Pyrenophora teres f. teres]
MKEHTTCNTQYYHFRRYEENLTSVLCRVKCPRSDVCAPNGIQVCTCTGRVKSWLKLLPSSAPCARRRTVTRRLPRYTPSFVDVVTGQDRLLRRHWPIVQADRPTWRISVLQQLGPMLVTADDH